jgi:hypothetical protein
MSSVMADDNDTEPETGEDVAIQARDDVNDSRERARAQAARVRESLVRYPGSGGSQAT